MRMVWIGIVLTASSAASADERALTVTLGGVGVVEMNDNPEQVLETFGGPRLTFGFEHAPRPYPATRGYNTGGALVPELIVGALMRERGEGEAAIGVGLRAEFQISQREGGLLRINAKSALYLAARGLVSGEQRDVIGELVFGDYVYLGSPARLGFEVGFTKRMTDGMTPDPTGALIQFYLGWAPR
jgi:hypothetical protein